MNKNKFIILISATMMLMVTFALFGPLELYMTQSSEFWFSLDDVAIIAASVFCVGSGLLIVLGIILNKINTKAFEIYTALVFGIGFVCYIQGNFMPISYGTLDGTEIIWSDYLIWGIINSLIWIIIIITILILSVRKYKLLKNIIICASLLCVLMQLSTISVLYFMSDKDQLYKPSENTLTTEDMYSVSKNENIIIFILDCFDSAVYDEFIEEYPEYTETVFDDFTYFQDTVGGATRTRIALPYILTGVPYNQNMTYAEYIEKAYTQTEIYKTLENAEYDMRIFTDASYISDQCHDEYIDNTQLTTPKVESFSSLGEKLMELVAFRYLPHYLKQYFVIYTGEFNEDKGIEESGDIYIIDDSKFYEDMIGSQLYSIEENAFRVFHLLGAHPPYTLTSEATRASSTSQYEQIKGNMVILAEYFSQMKELGVYETSNIIVMADHGESRNQEGNPILLVKESGSTDLYNISENSVSYANLHPTLLEMITHEERDLTFFSDLTEQHARYFYRMAGNQVVEYVTDDNNDENNLIETGNVYDMNAENKFELDKKYQIGGLGEGVSYFTEGLSGVETHYAWTNGNKLKIVLPVDNANDFIRINLGIENVYDDSQRVNIIVNDKSIGGVILDDEDKYLEFDIDPEIMEGDTLVVELELPDAIEPSYYPTSTNPDNRQLALAIGTFSVTTILEDDYEQLSNIDMTEPNLNKIQMIDSNMSFDLKKNSENEMDRYAIFKGWQGKEEAGCWTSESSSIYFEMEPQTDVIFKMPYSCYQNSVLESVSFNGYELEEKNDVLGTSYWVLPYEQFIEDDLQQLDFTVFGATSPKESGNGEDTRVLGMFVKNISFIVDYSCDFDLEYGFSNLTELTGNDYFVDGLSHSEAGGAWSSGSYSEIKLILEKTDKDLKIEFDVDTFGEQEVLVEAIDGDKTYTVFDGNVEERMISFIVLQEYINENTVVLKVSYPDAQVPENGDSRELAIFYKNMIVTQYDFTCNLGVTYNFTQENSSGMKYFEDGFSNLEDSGTWSDGELSQMRFVFEKSVEDLHFEFDVATLDEQYIQVDLLLDEGNLYNVFEGYVEDEKLSFIVPIKYVKDEIVDLIFTYPDAKMPDNGDTRQLAIFYQSMIVTTE